MKPSIFLNGLIASLVMICAQVAYAQDSPVFVDEPAVCFQCHDEPEDELQLKHVHTAYSAGKCSSCHNPHASSHATLMNDQVGELCLSCHDEIDEAIGRAVSHLPALEGACLDCHAPHASEHPNQLTNKMLSLCSACHTEILSWSQKTATHKPVIDGDCAACHDPHGGDNAALLVKDVPGICLDCHTADEAFVTRHGFAEIKNSDCITCHDPHASSVKGLLRANQHEPFAKGTCSACHDQENQSKPFAIKGTPERLCGRCHRTVGKTESPGPAFRHSDKRESYCLDCHNPHTSDVNSLLASKQEDLCMRCHFNSAEHEKEQIEYATHSGQDCSICHTLHLADNPKFLKSTGSDLCSQCHEGAHRVSHPIGDDIIDPRDDKPMTCLDCHIMHGSDYDKYLPLNPSQDLCLQCHKK